MSKQQSVYRLKPYFYLHILDNNTNVTRLEVGPQTFVRRDHETVVSGPDNMITIPPRQYCVIENPTIREEGTGIVLFDENGQVRVKIGDKEIRFTQDPFPLYPGEKLLGSVAPLQVINPDEAVRIRALRDCTVDGVDHKAGDEWLFEGPGTYTPRIDVKVVELIKATVVLPNTALLIHARRRYVDKFGNKREAGEEFLMRKEGAYLPHVDEKIIRTIKGIILTEKKAVHLKGIKTFVDVFSKTRKAGDEWLVTFEETEIYIPDVFEEVVGEIRITTLNQRQYCIVNNPVDLKTKKPRLGHKELRIGEKSFFLKPGESISGTIQNVHVLGEEEALLLQCRESYKDETVTRVPGEKWMIYGPRDYIPPVEVEIVERRSKIPLDENEGIYVRDMKTGKVYVKTSSSYMLKAQEELWEKTLPEDVRVLLESDPLADRGEHHMQGRKMQARAVPAKRDYTRVVSYRAPHNSAVQIYDYKKKKSRIVFGPDLVMLYPDEQFTVLNLSGGKPKRPEVIKSLALLLGPDFMTDIIRVETADHARLSLQLSYNWNFIVDKEKSEKLFSVPDFVGDACKAIASRVRGHVAQVSFDHFHKNSAKIIRVAVFGVDPETDEVRNSLVFNSNQLQITNIDIQSVEPIDQRTRDSLQKSVQMAIEITTSSQEASARHNAQRLEQLAKGKLERQMIADQAEAEKERSNLLQLEAESAAVESTGTAKAEAKAKAEAAQIEADASVRTAQGKADALDIQQTAELTQLINKQQADIDYQTKLNDLEVNRARKKADIEIKKFQEMVSAIGSDTIAEIARAGPEMQAKLLKGLGLQTMLLTDGKSPVNLFSTAAGLVDKK